MAGQGFQAKDHNRLSEVEGYQLVSETVVALFDGARNLEDLRSIYISIFKRTEIQKFCNFCNGAIPIEDMLSAIYDLAYYIAQSKVIDALIHPSSVSSSKADLLEIIQAIPQFNVEFNQKMEIQRVAMVSAIDLNFPSYARLHFPDLTEY